MSSILSSQYVTKPGLMAPALYITRLKNFNTVEEGAAEFESMKQRFMIEFGDTECQADGTMFQVNTGPGAFTILEFNTI